MEKESEYFLAEIAARISTLEAEEQKYALSLTQVRRNNGYRVFRKVIGVILEILCFLLFIAAVIAIFMIGEAKMELLKTLMLDNVLAGIYEPSARVIEMIDWLFFSLQVLAGAIAACMAFMTYLLAKVRIRNNTIKELSDLLEGMLHETSEQLKRARQTQSDFIRWKSGSEGAMPGPGHP